jgi:hypothetical protein
MEFTPSGRPASRVAPIGRFSGFPSLRSGHRTLGASWDFLRCALLRSGQNREASDPDRKHRARSQAARVLRQTET